MKVFVVLACWDYAGCEFIAVYETLDKAKKRKEEDNCSNNLVIVETEVL